LLNPVYKYNALRLQPFYLNINYDIASEHKFANKRDINTYPFNSLVNFREPNDKIKPRTVNFNELRDKFFADLICRSKHGEKTSENAEYDTRPYGVKYKDSIDLYKKYQNNDLDDTQNTVSNRLEINSTNTLLIRRGILNEHIKELISNYRSEVSNNKLFLFSFDINSGDLAEKPKSEEMF
jgi:hypothetical protein